MAGPISRWLNQKIANFRRKYGSPSFGGKIVCASPYARCERETGIARAKGLLLRYNPDEIRQHTAVFSCMSLISRDIAKCRPRLMQKTPDGIWVEGTNPAYTPVITRPNSYQNHIQFIESWIWSKLGHGNFYGLKVRDNRNVVTSIYPLDPWRVLPLVSNDGSGSIFYQNQYAEIE